jgi:membrane-bound ClpP family serine protease
LPLIWRKTAAKVQHFFEPCKFIFRIFSVTYKVTFFALTPYNINLNISKFIFFVVFLYLCSANQKKTHIMYLILTIILVLFGIGLLLAEMFLLPGFGVAGIFGFISLAGGVFFAYTKLTLLWAWAGHVTLGACILLGAIATYIFFKSKAVDKMSLDTKIEGGVDMPSPGKHMEELKN